MKYATKYLIAALALTSLFFVLPQVQAGSFSQNESLAVLLLASTGVLLARIFVLSSNSTDRIGIEPAVLVCLAAWNSPSLIYPITAVMTFSGSLINSLRTGKKLSPEIPEAIYQGVSFALLLKLGGYIYWNLPWLSTDEGAIETYLAMVVTVIPLILLRCISLRFSSGRQRNSMVNLKKNLLVNTFIILLAVPCASRILHDEIAGSNLLSCAFGLFSMLVVYGINLRQNRAAHEKTDELETVLRLKELSGNLFSATSEMDALRTLCYAVSAAWSCRVAARWKTITYFEGEKWDTANTVNIHHNSGLCIWIDSFSSTIPVYLESFLNRAVPVLIGLEAEKKMEKYSWESMETLISFVEQNSSDFAGFSRRVAATTSTLCRALKTDPWYEDCMRLAGLLHMISLPGQGEESYQQHPHALPVVTRQALEGMAEHWSGTGPAGKFQDEIPLPARILAVSIAWEKALNSGITMAIRDINMRAGTIYDPRLAELVIQLNS